MGFQKGNPGGPGRPRGAPNKVHRLEAICAHYKIDLFEEGVRLLSLETDLDKRFSKIAELLPYIHPKQKAQDITIKSETEAMAEEFEALPSETQVKLLEEQIKKLKGES